MGRGNKYRDAAKVPPPPKHICPVCNRQFILRASLANHRRKEKH